MRLIRPAAVALATGVAISACSAGGAGNHPAARSASSRPISATAPTTHGPAVTTAPATSAPTTAPPPTSPPTTAVPTGWSVVASTAAGPAIEKTTVALPDGDTVVLLRYLAGRTLFRLHVGSTDPPGAASVPAAAGPAVTAAERPLLLGAFNGGFKTNTYSGGVEVDGMVLTPLRVGEASLVIDTNGTARVAVWGSGAPLPGEPVASVRQNLPPLVSGGRPSSAINVISAWGATLHGYNNVARSALGTDSAGNLVYAGSSSAVPADLSTALIDAGCVTAMELDINPYWVQADVAATPGAALAAAVPNQNQSASQYLSGWSRDFVTVLAGS